MRTLFFPTYLRPLFRSIAEHFIIPSSQASGCGLHIVCCVPIAALGEHNIKSLAEVILWGLLGFILLESIRLFFSRIANIILASPIKLITAAPYLILPYVISLVPYFLKLCGFFYDEGDVPLHLMGIQCLISITIFPKALRSMVTSHLDSAVNHSSHTFQQEAVQVIN